MSIPVEKMNKEAIALLAVLAEESMLKINRKKQAFKPVF
jgi:hypothetical protein